MGVNSGGGAIVLNCIAKIHLHFNTHGKLIFIFPQIFERYRYFTSNIHCNLLYDTVYIDRVDYNVYLK